MERHKIKFKYSGAQDDNAITLAFSKKKVDERKDWLSEWMEEGKRRKELALPEVYLYEKDTKAVNYQDFVNKELVLFSNMDNERSIPCLVDGFKPGQRKVFFTCLKRNLTKEIKVAQLAGAVSEKSAYHHGEASLMGTIVGLAQNYVGSNNVNLLVPVGQFGTRLTGGKDSASTRWDLICQRRCLEVVPATRRYLFTWLSPLARAIFPPRDDHLLNFLAEDDQRVEPDWLVQCTDLLKQGFPIVFFLSISQVHPHSADDPGERRRRDRHRLDDQDPQLQPEGDRGQPAAHA